MLLRLWMANHSTMALKYLATEMPEDENFKRRQIILYAGLSDEDALYLGYRRNENSKCGKGASTYTLLCLMRRQLVTASGGTDISDDKVLRGNLQIPSGDC